MHTVKYIIGKQYQTYGHLIKIYSKAVTKVSRGRDERTCRPETNKQGNEPDPLRSVGNFKCTYQGLLTDVIDLQFRFTNFCQVQGDRQNNIPLHLVSGSTSKLQVPASHHIQ